MPNISGEYTLAEVAAKLGVSQSWIGKVRSLTGIGGPIGVQGKKAAFTEEDVALLGRANIMRVLDFDYKDIKHCYDVEEKIIKLFSGGEGKALIGNHAPFFLHNPKQKLYSPSTKEDAAKIYNERVVKLLPEYTKIILEIKRRAELLRDKLQKEFLSSETFSDMFATIEKQGLSFTISA